MDSNFILDIIQDVRDQIWLEKLDAIPAASRLCPWISSFHPDNLACHIEEGTYNGSFNVGLKAVFTDGTAWMVRFPREGRIHPDFADEKIAMEVSTLRLLRDKTCIPVPKVWAWGIASSNPLNLGPFIMIDFIKGVNLRDVLIDSNAEPPTRLMREDINEKDLEYVYRQLAVFLLQLFKLDFEKIGSLPWPDGKTALPRPLTLKAHNILQNGGVDPFGNRSQGFLSTTDYLRYLAEQDWKQLISQPNSTRSEDSAKSDYLVFNALKKIPQDLVHPNYDKSQFKLICDDLGLGNLMVRSTDDLTVVAVIDLEWSYVGPAQMLATAPWWLLMDRPVNTAWDCENDKLPKAAERYSKSLEIFMRVLEEEEGNMPGHGHGEFSSLVKWSQTSGAAWLHMALSTGFIGQCTFPVTRLRQHLGDKWPSYVEQFDDSELHSFSVRKEREREEYDEALGQLVAEAGRLESEEITKEEFLAIAFGKVLSEAGKSSDLSATVAEA